MVKDHSAANEQLKALAEAKNITLPATSSVNEVAAKIRMPERSPELRCLLWKRT